MPNALADSISPYLRSHADNPVAWQPWGEAAFVEARRRDVPVLVSIGYSTCHWCHVMARESFSDPELAEHLNDRFVAVKVDREEHPDVDASYLAAASAFTGNLGWPLTVFVTPEGRAFYAGTYYPPTPVQGHPSFTQVLDAVTDAWTSRRGEVETTAAEIQGALAAQPTSDSTTLPTEADLQRVVALLAEHEDREFTGFGAAPKFPVAPIQNLLVKRAAGGDAVADALVGRTLAGMAASPLRDHVDGGFFRYATRRDWHDPHYERMLYDNALLLDAYSRREEPGSREERGSRDEPGTATITTGIASFLLATLRRPSGGFGSAQDSESILDGARNEGGWYALDAEERARHPAPAVDDKVLTGWNGLAIGALAEAGARHGHPEWIRAARDAAAHLLAEHRTPTGELLRAGSDRGLSAAPATLEDYGMLATGLIRLALATGDAAWAVEARTLVDACLLPGGEPTTEPENEPSGDKSGAWAPDPRVFAPPTPGNPVLLAQGTQLSRDPSEGAYPSGLSAMATAAFLLSQLSASPVHRDAASRAVASVTALALDSPIAFGASLSLAADLAAEATQLVVVAPEAERDGPLARAARDFAGPGRIAAVVTPEQALAWAAAGFELFEGRTALDGHATAYLCRDFACRLPVTTVEALQAG
ncbi:thioredoxin domain-containing protein [Frondihabitans cladoniiphilus]|uniref:thioredoxin domain-containing protein n=1 Tax=Frondihabitans cladoniiphilus TaxID=715785 RepID=UPI0031EF4F30